LFGQLAIAEPPMGVIEEDWGIVSPHHVNKSGDIFVSHFRDA